MEDKVKSPWPGPEGLIPVTNGKAEDANNDAYKALALGADAVAVGRGILAPLLKEGMDGVVKKVRKMNEQLSELMMYTGIADTKSFDSSVIHHKKSNMLSL